MRNGIPRTEDEISAEMNATMVHEIFIYRAAISFEKTRLFNAINRREV